MLGDFYNYGLHDWAFITPFVLTPYIIIALSHYRKSAKKSTEVEICTNEESFDITQTPFIETDDVIYQNNKKISNEEVSRLIQTGYEATLKSNVTQNRTERENELSFQFMMNHGIEIQKHTNNFENCCRLAYKENDLSKKIELLKQTITKFEQSKKWFYRTKGGNIYFQDYYEHQHNSNNPDFSYIDSVNEYLDYCVEKRDYIIPQILQIIYSQGSILQKDIYQHIPDVSKSEIQEVSVQSLVE